MTGESAADDVEKARTATLRRVGRNLVNAQRIETLLKFLLTINLSGPMRELEARFKKHVERVSRNTLGSLISETADVLLLDVEVEASNREVKEVWITHAFRIPMDAERRAEWSSKWDTLRLERNRLVHVMLAGVDFNSPEQCQRLDPELDSQNALFLDGIAYLGPIVKAAKEAIAELASGKIQFDPPVPGAPKS